MRCPVCPEADLVMSERHGVEIDYCPRCRGVWLDRGELDKIIERAEQERPARQLAADQRPGSDRYRSHGSGRYPKRRKSFWSELFD